MFDLRRIGAVTAILTVVWFGLGRIASAQTTLVVTAQGILSTVNDDGNGLTLTATMTTPNGIQSYVVSKGNTSVWVGYEKISPTVLDRFVGTPAIVLSTPVGRQQVAGRINLLVFPVQGQVGTAVSSGDDSHGVGGAASNIGGGTTGAGTTGGGTTSGGTTGGGTTGGGTTGGGTTGGGTTGGGTTGGGTTGGGTTGGGTTGGGTTGGGTTGGDPSHGNGQGSGNGNGSGEKGDKGIGHGEGGPDHNK